MSPDAYPGRQHAPFCGCWQCLRANSTDAATATNTVYLDELTFITPADPTPHVGDKRCKRCMEQHSGKPCRAEMRRGRGARKVRTVYR